MLLGAFLAGGCASRTPPPRDNLDPLFRAPDGTGEYLVDPAELGRRAPQARARRNLPPEPPAPQPGKDAPLPCKHTWEWLGLQTHAYMDRDGSPTLCTPRVCTQCGLLIHACSGGR